MAMKKKTVDVPKAQLDALLSACRFADRVLEGCVPSAGHSGQRRARQFERIDEARYALIEALAQTKELLENQKEVAK